MRKILLLAVLLSTALTTAQDYTKGKQLFNTHCAACHKMDKKLVGPPLQDVVELQGAEWTKKWIYNSKALIDAGDEHAVEIWEEYNRAAMPAYNFLPDSELDDIVEYLAQYKPKKEEALAAQNATTAPVAGGTTTVVQSEPSTWLYLLLAVALIMSLVGLYALHKGLQAIVKITTRGQSTNLYLMKKLNMDQDSVEQEFDEMIEGEVQKRTDAKIKDFKKSVNKKLKGL